MVMEEKPNRKRDITCNRKNLKASLLTLSYCYMNDISGTSIAVTATQFFTLLQFMRPRARDKKLIEEWAVPLKNVEDIHEVEILYCI